MGHLIAADVFLCVVRNSLAAVVTKQLDFSTTRTHQATVVEVSLCGARHVFAYVARIVFLGGFHWCG